MAKVANLKSNIQSKIQSDINEKQKQITSSSAAVKWGSTETPTVTDTPKVTPTAKSVQSIPKVNVTPVSVATTNPQPTNAKDLLSSSVTSSVLRKSATPNLLSTQTEQEEVKNTTMPLDIIRASINVWWQAEQAVNENLYQQGLDWINEKFGKLREASDKLTEKVWKTSIDLFKWVWEDISTQWSSWEWIWMVRDFVANTLEWLPRWITRVEYWLAEMLDWASDAAWVDVLKEDIESNLDYWENTRVYKRVWETTSFSDFLKNPWMYAGGTFTEMLPMFISPWVAVPTTYAQMYWDAYKDYAQDESLQDLNDNQIRLMATWVATVNTIIELWADLIQWIMPWTKTIAKWTEREVRRALSKPFANLLKKIVKWWASEWIEEVLQNEIQTQVAIAGGSDRPSPTWAERFNIWAISASIWGMFWGWDFMVNIKQSKELQQAFNEWSEAVDKIAPWVSKSDKEKLFSAIVAAEMQDAQIDEDTINKYEAQTTELYNQIEELNKQLETTTNEEEKFEINRKIETATKKINDIDEIINSANKITEEVNTKLQELSEQKELEELHKEVKIQMPKEVWGENLSTQTMKEIKQDEIEVWDQKEFKIPNTSDWYESLYNALHEPQNTLLKNMSYEELLKMKNDLQLKFREALINYDYRDSDNLRFIIKRINEEISEKKWEYQGTLVKKLKFKNVKDYIQQMINIDKKNWDWSSSRDRTMRERYMSQFLRTNLEWDFAAHMPWLKWVNLKQIEKELTEDKIKQIAEMLSLISTTFWIDFNKIISDKSLSMNIVDNIKDFLYNTNSLGQMTWLPTKEQVMDLMRRTWERVTIWQEILKTWVIVTLDEWPARAAATMAHELWHLIDVAISTEEWLPLYFKDGKIGYTSIIKDDYDWKTFKQWQAKPRTKTYNYYHDWTEILARYAEQYFAYKQAPEVFEEFSKRNWYWSTEEFEKLLPKFESFIQDRLWAKLLDEQNIFYNEIVHRINENKFQTTSMEFSKWEVSENEVKQRMEQMKEEYMWIMQAIEWMQWDLKEEMEAYVQLSNLQSNYEMAMKKWFEYLDMLKTKPEQQEWIDDTTVAVVPDPPQNPWTIENWLPMLWWSNIENGIWDIAEWGNGWKLWDSYMKEETIIKIRKRKNKIKNFRRELTQTWKDILTPTISRIYNISPRVAWRLITMETQKDINIHRYRQQAKWFVETLGNLKGKQALEVKMALLDYWALASEQGENIEQYKKDEVAKLKEVLLRNWFREKDINDMFSVLDDIWRQYEDVWLKITRTDMYFPRVVKDYEWLIDYMNKVSGNDIKVNKVSLMARIRNIQADTKLTEEEKEARIRRAISVEYKQPWTTSQHGKERKMWKLSDWWEWIFAYYESPIESIDHYITSMVNAIQRQLFLWGLKEDANIDADIINQDTVESVSQIIWKLVEDGKISEDDVEELQKSILAVLNKKPSPKSVTAIKDVTYMSTITNFLSAINQLDDLWMVILKDRSWLKHIVKAIFWMANIKYDDLWLEDAYEMFREEWWVTNWLFKKSLFNTFDRLGKTSFVNAAWESMMRQAKNAKTRQYLYTRLQSMYWTESADRMMEKIDKWDYMEDGQIDIEILRDLLYQLWSTQPLYTSAMPTTYLNHPRARLCYALSSFTLKRIDWLVQWTKEVNKQHWPVAAAAWLMSVSSFLAMFWAVIWDAWDLLKWDTEETFLWKLINEWIDEALKAWGSDALDSWLKIWDLSEYDIKLYKQQWLWWLFASKMKPFIFDLGKDIMQAIEKRDANEITDLAKYVPILWKLVYYWCWDDLKSSTESTKSEWDWWEDMERDWWDMDNWEWEDDLEWDWS